MLRNAEEIDHDKTDVGRIGAPRRELDAEYLSDIPRDIAILEVGSGYGRQLETLQTLGFTRLVGLDLNLGGLRRSSLLGVQADAVRLPFGDNAFDLVSTSGMLMHVHPLQLRQVTDELVRVTRKWIWCFEQVAAKLTPLFFNPDLGIPPAWLWDLPALMSTLQPTLGLTQGKVWEGPKGQYAMLMYLKGAKCA